MGMHIRTLATVILCLPILAAGIGCNRVADDAYQLNSKVLAPDIASPPHSRNEPGAIKVPKVVSAPVSVAPIEFNRKGGLFECKAPDAPDCQMKRAEDHISAARQSVALSPNQQLVVITYIHGWHHNASWYSYNFRNFQRMIDCLNWGAATYAKLYGASQMIGPNPVSCTHGVADPNVRYAGVYIGWPGESVAGGLGSITSLPAEHSTAINVSEGQVRNSVNRLVAAAKTGTSPARFILIGHSFGGLIAGRFSAASLLPEFETASSSPGADCGDSPTGHRNSIDLVVLVNAADNSVRAADLIREMKSDKASSSPFFCQTDIKAPGKPIARPIILSLHTPSDSATEGEGAFALKFAHDDDNYVHRKELDAITFEKDALETNPGFDMMKSKPINRLLTLHSSCYLDQEKTGDFLCDRLNDLMYSLKKKTYEDTMGHPLKTRPTLGQSDPYYHGVYEIILSVCRNQTELAGDSEFPAPACDAALQADREKLTAAFVTNLNDYFAVPEPMPGNRPTILLDLYKRIGLSCDNGDWTRSEDGSLCSGSLSSDLSHVKRHDVWNTTPYWFVNVSYEIIEKHSGFWNQDVFNLITDLSYQSPVTPLKP